MKLVLALTAALTLSSGIALAGTPAAAPKAKARVATCTTPGDALGGLTVFFSKTTEVIVRESTMEGKTLTYRAAATPADWSAFSAGRDVSFVWYPANAPMFGGAVSKASILTLHTRAGAQSRGFLSRGGTVYYLTCNN